MAKGKQKREKEEVVIRYVLADCHGVESYSEQDSQMMVMRANANRQRHAIYFRVQLTKEEDKQIFELVKQHQMVAALKRLKELREFIDFPQQMKAQYNNSLDLIPNNKLNPWGNRK